MKVQSEKRPLASFYDQVKTGAPGLRLTKKPAPPVFGTLDRAEAMRAKCFFS